MYSITSRFLKYSSIIILSNPVVSFTFLFNEFVQLRLLTLTEVRHDDLSQLKSILPLISQLSCVRLIESAYDMNGIFSALLPSFEF